MVKKYFETVWIYEKSGKKIHIIFNVPVPYFDGDGL